MYHTLNVNDPTFALASKLAKRDGRTIGIIIAESLKLYATAHKTKREPVHSRAGRPKTK